MYSPILLGPQGSHALEALPRNCPYLKESTLALPSRNLMVGHLGVQVNAAGPLSGFGVTIKASQLQLSHRVSQTPGEAARQFNFSLCQEQTTEDSGFVPKETENSKVPAGIKRQSQSRQSRSGFSKEWLTEVWVECDGTTGTRQ